MKRSLLLVALTVLPLAATAQDFDYTYVEGWIVNTELDVGASDLDGDGIEINGSFDLNEDLYVLASYADTDYDAGVDSSVLAFGVGFHSDLNEDLDFIADLQYISADFDSGIGDEDGFQIGGGVRAWVHQDVELKGTVHYVDLGDSDTVLSVSGYYHLHENFAVGAELSDGDAFGWAVGIRAFFGER